MPLNGSHGVALILPVNGTSLCVSPVSHTGFIFAAAPCAVHGAPPGSGSADG